MIRQAAYNFGRDCNNKHHHSSYSTIMIEDENYYLIQLTSYQPCYNKRKWLMVHMHMHFIVTPSVERQQSRLGYLLGNSNF